MIEKNKCVTCKTIYEIVWDDDDSDYYSSAIEDDDDFEYADDVYPQYCPFCGLHREYGGEEDSYDDYDK